MGEFWHRHVNGLPEWEAVIHWLWKEYSDDMSKLRRMKDLLRKAAPLLLIGGLLALNLLDLRGTPEQQPIPEAQEQPELKAPTPAPVRPRGSAWGVEEYPILPGRLYFEAGDDLVILEKGGATGLPLPEQALLPPEIAPAFSPDGRELALFAPSGNQHFLQRLPLEVGLSAHLEFPVPNPGPVRWSPDSQELLTWTLDGSILTLRLLDGGVRYLPFTERVTDAVWSPDSLQVAIETEGESIYILDRETAELERIEGVDPIWGPRGLLFLRPSAPNQGFLRSPTGEEIPTTFTETESWAQAKVLDLGYRQEAPGLHSAPGHPPARIRMLALGAGARPNSYHFTFRVDQQETRYGVGLVVDGQIQLWLYPPTDAGICFPKVLQDTLSSLYLQRDGGGCSSELTRLPYGSDRAEQIHWGQSPLIDSTGAWIIAQEGSRFTITNVEQRHGYSISAPLMPIYWDGR